MAFDPYAPCPCGSGKKLKFCCQAIADDMDRINRLIENQQLRAALHQLESLDRRQPQNEWITTTRALILIETGDAVAARDILKAWLATHPDAEFALCLFATAQLQAEGYDAAKKSIQKAFQRGAKVFPALVSGLAGAMAAVMDERRQPLAVRECLSLALRFAADRDRQELFIRLLEFDNSEDVYYPLRSLHPLPSVNVPEEHDKDYKRALKWAMIGSWDLAADALTGLADKLPELTDLRRSAGLCRAWDGDDRRASQALHQAALQSSDFPVAVECEVLAQLLDLEHSPVTQAFLATDGEVPSVSRLLSILDQQPRLVRQPVRPNPQEQTLTPSALYQILDRPALTATDVPTLTRDSLPNVWGQVVIYDANKDQPAKLVLSGMGGTPFDGALDILRTAAGEQIAWASEPPETLYEMPQELWRFGWQWNFPPKTPLSRRQELERQQWSEILTDRWPNQSQAVLGGKSPREAAQDPALRTAVTAAVYVLDAVCEQRKHSLDVAAMFQRLGLEPLPPLTLSSDSQPNSLSLLQLQRLTIPALTDAQLSSVLNRAMLIHHDGFLQPVLEEALKRPACLPNLELPRVYQTLADLCAQHGDLNDAYRWIDEARRQTLGDHPPFEAVWQWDLRELMLRLTTPSDPALRPLIQKFAVYYGPKVPQLRTYLELILEEAGLESPWSGGGLVSPELAGAGAVWSPGQEAAPAGSSKLWLPGQ